MVSISCVAFCHLLRTLRTMHWLPKLSVSQMLQHQLVATKYSVCSARPRAAANSRSRVLGMQSFFIWEASLEAMLNTGKISSELADVRPDSRESMYLPASRADRLLAATPSGSIICVTAFGSSEETSYRVACLVVAAVGVVQGCSKHLFEGDCVIQEIVAGIQAMLSPVMRN